MKFEYTKEQQDVLDYMVENDGIMLVEAKAGSGKSFMSRQIVKELPITSGIYTAFNKSIVEEGVNKFANTPVECKTLHALAYKYVKPKSDIKPLSYKCIKENITYSEKRKLIDALDSFFVSSSICMDEYFNEYFKLHRKSEKMTKLSISYVNGMVEGTVNPTFNFLLKYLHLLLVEDLIQIKTDIVILDEINDVTAVALEIFRHIDAPKKLGLGETNQAIYQFLNLVNGFEVLKDEAVVKEFTQSYRCSKEIAERIEKKMQKEISPKFRFKGTNKPVTNGKTLFCTLTNALIINEIKNRLSEGKGFTLLRKPSDIFAVPLAVLSASQGKKPYQAKFEFLLDVYDDFKNQKKFKTFFKFLVAEVNDDEINNAVKLLQKLNSEGINLFTLYKETKEARKDPDYIISTVFTAKGLEMETVYIASDLDSKFAKSCNNELDEEETLITNRCMYVACSRAGVNLFTNCL